MMQDLIQQQGSKLSVAISTTPSVASLSPSENLRCPRCDSSNTKFCYYNNYNLTQPRHFCKTCRRYWTKGGALRNVPIGGGCRRNKTATAAAGTITPSSSVKRSGAAAGRVKAITSSSAYGPPEHDPPCNNPIQCPASSSPHHHLMSSHLLSLLRANPNPKPIGSLENPVTHREESFVLGSQMMSMGPSPSSMVVNEAFLLSGQAAASVDHRLTSTDYSRSNYYHMKNQQSGFIGGGIQGLGLQEMFRQRLIRSPTNCYTGDDHQLGPLLLGNAASSSSTILDTAPLPPRAEVGFYWNNSVTWSDAATAAPDAFP